MLHAHTWTQLTERSTWAGHLRPARVREPLSLSFSVLTQLFYLPAPAREREEGKENELETRLARELCPRESSPEWKSQNKQGEGK